MAADISPKIGLDGEKEFKNAINDVNQSIKTLGSELKVISSDFDSNKDAMSKLKKENENYKSTVEKLSEKLALQKQRLDEATAAYGETDSRTQKLRQQYNETQAQINTYNGKIEENNQLIEQNGQTDEEVAKQVEEDAKKQEKAHEKVQSALSAVGTAFTAMAATAAAAMAAAATGVAELASSLYKMTINAAYAADDLNTLSTQTGISTEELQKMQYASEMIDVSVDTMTGSLTKLTKNMDSAASGSGDAYEAFQALGIEVTNQDGTLRDRNEVFNEAIAALGEITDETNRDATAMKIFGKSAQELNPLIEGGAEALEEYGQQAQDAGLILSQDDLDALNQVSDAMDTLKATTSAAGNLFAVGFAEPLSAGLNAVTGYAQELTAAFSEGGLQGMMEALPGVVDELVTDIQENLPGLLETGSEMLSVLLNGILEVLPDLVDVATEIIEQLSGFLIDALPVLAEAAIEIVGSLTTGIIDHLPELIDCTIKIIETIVKGVIDNLDNILEAALEIIQTLADALIEDLPELIPSAVEAVLQLVTTLTDPDTLTSLVDAAAAIIIALAQGIVACLPTLIEQAPVIISNLMNALIEVAPELLEAAVVVIKTIVEGIIDNLPAILDAGKDIISSILEGMGNLFVDLYSKGADIVKKVGEGFSSLVSNAVQWGKDMIQNFIDGIVAKWNALISKVSDLAGTVASYLGFSEPEKGPLSDFHTYAPDMIELFAEGMEKSKSALKRQLSKTAGLISDSMAMTVSPDVNLPSMLSGALDSVNLGLANMAFGGGADIVINLSTELDGQTLAQNQYRYNLLESSRHGAALVTGG